MQVAFSKMSRAQNGEKVVAGRVQTNRTPSRPADTRRRLIERLRRTTSTARRASMPNPSMLAEQIPPDSRGEVSAE
jgi:hypothetical protein